MKECNAVEVHRVVKKFKVYQDKGHTIKERALFKRRRKYEERTVLDEISFEIPKGQAVGLIGHNGCGKSTTLKLLTRIMYPDAGTVEMQGRVSSLIELGAGFHPDMSGRQNIYINASIFGLTKKEIDSRLHNIIAFSELEEYIDNPVRTYSSGMYMRLAFSVAINVDADILLIDEILAVGDANFQAKCFNRLREIKSGGTTIVIVSHAMGQIEQICDRSIWIHDGKIKADGIPREVDPIYLDFMGQQRQTVSEKKEECSNTDVLPQECSKEPQEPENKKRWGNGLARIKNISMKDVNGKSRSVFKVGEDIIFKIHYCVNKTVEDACFGIGIFRSDGVQCFGTNTKIEQMPLFHLEEDGYFTLNLKEVSLLPGEYWVDIAIECGYGIPVDYFTKALRFETYSEINDVGIARINHTWKSGSQIF
ncbi:MAG: ABC transporter ATP-binding protein [Lachnospiraceae bacterium]|jgi:ABC-type polysaccharide/polyol phosphate transport system ATPase subunit|nr:ABC transporter ATP-binding protein [Lachnospiraceae bacterium]